MRRKSSRSAAKASPEKPTEPTRRSRRHSKRRKRSSSGSSDDDSNDVPLQALVSKSLEIAPEPEKTVEDPLLVEEPVWKVTPSAAPSGEIQKLKICLTRPIMSSPEKTEVTSRRRRNKSGSRHDEDVTSSEDVVTTRKSRHRGSVGKSVDESGFELEEPEDKKGKGKSKSKTKSKNEKSQEIQEIEDRTESEISENIQVTPQSPQAAIDIRVDNETMSNTENESVNNEESNSVSQTSEFSDATQEDTTEQNSKSVEENVSNFDEQQSINIVESEPVTKFSNSEQTVIEKIEIPVQEVEETIAISSESSSPKSEESIKELTIKSDDQQNSNSDEIKFDTETIQIEESKSDNVEIVPSEEKSENVEQPTQQEVTVIETTTVIKSADSEVIESLPPSTDEVETVNDEQAQVVAQTEVSNEPEPIESVVQGEVVSEEQIQNEDEIVPKVSTLNKEDVEKVEVNEENNQSSFEEQPEIEQTDDTEPKREGEQPEIEQTDGIESKREEEQPEIEQTDDSESKSEEGQPEIEQTEDSESKREEEQPEIEQTDDSEKKEELKSGGSSSDEADKDETDNQVLILQSKDIIDETMKSPAADSKPKSDEESTSADNVIKTSPNKKENNLNLHKASNTEGRKIQRKRKWGNSLAGLEFTKPVIKNIDIDTIKQFCPDLQFLEENEVKIEAIDRRTSFENDRKVSRKVSIDYKTNDVEHRRLETQSSVNSSDNDVKSEQEVGNSNIIAMNRKISIVDDTASKLKPPPSPAKNPVSSILFISNLVRPFTLKQLKELLERTGKIVDNGFWTDRIKSKCYVCYETNAEAEGTRNALHGVHWPIGNGKKLMIDYSTPEDMERARNPTPPPVIIQPKAVDPEDIENQSPIKKPKIEEEKHVKEREVNKVEKRVREWDIGKEDLHRVKSRSRERDSRHDKHERNDRHKHRRTPTPTEDFISRKQRKKEEEIPQKLMDDLFQKTKATPSIYWLPLTPEEIATKQQQRLLRMAEHKRRIEESNRNRGDYGRGAPYRRRYN